MDEIIDDKNVVSQIRPWIRYWARFFDYLLFGFVFGAVIAIVNPTMLELPDILLNMFMIFIWIFVETSLLSTWGTTPGKYLFSTTLRDSEGNKLTFLNALNRSFSVWWRGMGIGFPIATLITLIVAYKYLTREHITTWDQGFFVVSHNKISMIRAIVAVLFFIGFFFLIVLGSSVES